MKYKVGLKTSGTDIIVLSGARQTSIEWLSTALSGFLSSHLFPSCLSLGYYGPIYMSLSYSIRAQYLVKHNYLKMLIEYSPLSLRGLFISFLTQVKIVKAWVFFLRCLCLLISLSLCYDLYSSVDSVTVQLTLTFWGHSLHERNYKTKTTLHLQRLSSEKLS